MEAIKKIISELVFDVELVNEIKEHPLTNEKLYSLVNSGKLSLREYLSLAK